MADDVSTTARRMRKVWDRRFNRYRRAKLLRDAEYAFGVSKDAADRAELYRTTIDGMAGSIARAKFSHPNHVAELERLNAEVERAEDRAYVRYSRPADRAALLVMRTPAPDLDAVAAKVRLIKREDLHGIPDIKHRPFDFVEADVRRLRGLN